MTKQEKKEYIEAIDIVCINCIYSDVLVCDDCPVRKSFDETFKNEEETK